MEITYGSIDYTTKLLSSEMSEQQALQSDFYEKIFRDNGLIKKYETYSEQNLLGIDYYLDTGEDESQLLQQFYQQVNFVTFIDRKVALGEYFVERERGYDKNSELGIRYKIRVYDNQDRLVCCQNTDENDTPIVSTDEDSLVKFCYISRTREVGDPTLYYYFLKFIYQDETGMIPAYGEPLYIDWHLGHNILDNQSYNDDFNNINEVIEELGNTVDYSYYLHANWMP